MLKKVLFLALVLCIRPIFAQDLTAEMFQSDNPNLMNLGEAKEYNGSPLVYIDGVKAPEQATNSLEELQLEFFGTKDIQSKTHNSLNFQPIKREQGLKPNITIETPFHQTVTAGLMRHIPDFLTIIQVLNNSQIIVTEQVSIISVRENEIWTRDIPLPNGVDFQVTSYIQNGQTVPVKLTEKGKLAFQSPVPLNLGLNHILLEYTISDVIQNKVLKLDLTGTQLDWPIERMNAMILFPNKVQFIQNKLLFGTNEMEVPQAYTTQLDERGNTFYHFSKIIPPLASIRIYVELENALLASDDFGTKFWRNTSLLLMTAMSVIMLLYWFLYALWTRRQLHQYKIPRLTKSTNWLFVAHQLRLKLTVNILNKLEIFLIQHNLPVKIPRRLFKSKKKNQYLSYPLMIRIKSLLRWVGELAIGSLLLIGLYVALARYLEVGVNPYFVAAWLIATILVLTFFYHYYFQSYAKLLWQKCIQKFSTKEAMIGLTRFQAKLVYPLMILIGSESQWLSEFESLNPKEAKEL